MEMTGSGNSKYSDSENNVLIIWNNLRGKDKRFKVNSKDPTVLVMFQ